MRNLVRAVFGLNFLYQLVIGGISLLAPALAIELYQAPAGETLNFFLRGTLRTAGAALLLGAAVSALIARNPERNPVLLPLIALLALTTLIAEAMMLATGEANAAQIGFDALVQIVILMAVFTYYPRMRAAAAEAAPAMATAR
ncbi:MAG: hypothetical protein ACT4O1_11925 [Gemmatimonadota bacterium]